MTPPRICAHRGGSLEAPENTLGAFRQALARGIQMVELDVRLSADGQCVVIHDPDVERTTGQRGPVGSFTAAELGRMNAASHFPGWSEPEPVPTLDTCIQCLRQSGAARVLIEVKRQDPGAYRDICRQIQAIGHRYGMSQHMVLASFDPEFVQTAAAEAAGYSRALIGEANMLAQSGLDCDWAMIDFRSLGPATMQQARADGIQVACWTPNTAADLARCLSCQPDIIITDAPALATRLLAPSG